MSIKHDVMTINYKVEILYDSLSELSILKYVLSPIHNFVYRYL
jgi:hypothetical protein